LNNHRHSRLWIAAGMSLILVMLLFIASGCDAALAVKGTVYEWVDAPAGSNGDLYINTEAPAGRMIKPVANASVILSVSSGIEPHLTTDENGSFAWQDVFPAGLPRKVNVQIEKGGYTTITGGFQRDNVHYSLVIFLVRNKEGSSSITTENSGQISSSQYVFIEHHTSVYGEPVEGEYPFMFIDFPLYFFNEKTGSLDVKRVITEINDSVKAVYGDGMELGGCAGSGMSSNAYGVYDFPYEYSGLKILEIEGDGTAHLSYKGLSIVLKSGEKWSNVGSTIDTKENNGKIAKAKITTTDTIMNYGILDKSKISH
jgi:hypothetical protein